MSEAHRSTILIVMGSVRVGRRCPQIAQWVRGILERTEALACEIVDLREWHLPSDDEPGIPANGDYVQPHTRAWSAKVSAAQGVVIVTPQYNWGYPAPLKNALDHLYGEWSGKPLMIVTYGGHGGNKCAQQLRQVASGLKMRPVETMPSITISHAAIDQNLPLSADDLNRFTDGLLQASDELRSAVAFSS